MNITNINNNDDKKDLDDMLVLYALGALDSEESEVVEAEIQNNPELQAKVEDMRAFDAKLTKSLTLTVAMAQTPKSIEQPDIPNNAINKPDKDNRKIALTHLFEGLTHQEIAIIMGISETQVDTLLSQTFLELSHNL